MSAAARRLRMLASRGIASMSINVVGHGGAPLGRLVVVRTGGAPNVTPASCGRGIHQNGNGLIDTTEGVSAMGPQGIVNNRDGLRQTVVDLMQLVRLIETGGVDVDADGTATDRSVLRDPRRDGDRSGWCSTDLRNPIVRLLTARHDLFSVGLGRKLLSL